MIHRSYRSLLLTLTRNFCKDNNNKEPINPNVQNNAERPFKNKKHQIFQNKSKESNPQQTDNQQQKQTQDRPRKIFNKDRNDQQDRRVFKKKNNQPGFDWEKTTIDPAKYQEISVARDNFNALFQKNELENELRKDIENINEEKNSKNLVNNFDFYLKKDFIKAKEFFIKNLSNLESKSQNAKDSLGQITLKIARSYIENQNIEQLVNFLETIPENMQLNHQKVIALIENVSELEQSVLSLKGLTHLIKKAKLHNLQPGNKKRLEVISRKIIQNYAQQRKIPNKSTNQSFQQVFQSLIKLNLLPLRYIKSPSFQKAIQTAYFNNVNSKESYNNFFRTISSIKATITTQDDYLEQFFNWMLRALENHKLATTDCENPPFLVTPTLIENYQKYFTAQNKEVTLTIVAICLVNGYLSIPEHFLQEHIKNFKITIPNQVINTLKDHIKLLQLDSYVRNEQHTENAKSINQAKRSLQIQLGDNKKQLTQLKVFITTKNYEKAMQLFNKQHFRQLCIQRERLVIYTVLFNFLLKEGQTKMNQKDLSYTVNSFVETLSQQYLWDSWKKSEDIGYLLEDYYITENDTAGQSKEQKRFSFWDSYFEVKRAKQINKFELLGELPTIKQPNQNPYIQNQFNLNKYLTGESFQRYRQVTDYHNQKDVELTLYLYKIQSALLQLKAGGDQDVRASVITFQNDLCEENLKYIQQFGLKDYDVTVHDPEQLLNRIENMKKVRGVIRLQSIYDRMYKNQKQFEQYQQAQKARQQRFRNNKKWVPAKQSNAAAPEPTPTDQVQQAPKQEAVQQAVAAQTAQTTQTQAVQPSQQTEPVQQAQQTEQPQQGEQAQQAVAQVAQEASQNIPVAGQAQQQPAEIVTKKVDQKHISLKKPEDYVNNQSSVRITKQFVDILRVKRRNLFTNAAINVKLNPDPVVNELIRWGLLNRQPMAIYMGQKLAMLTKQIIPHHLAIRISDLFSYNREINEKLFADCKLCLTYIGKIDREFIYDDSKIYQHILYKPKFNTITSTLNTALFQRLEDLVLENPRLDYRRTQPRELARELNKSTPI